MIKYLVIAAVVAAGIFCLTSCIGGENDSISSEEYLKKCQEYLEANGKREGVVTTASGLQYEVITEGREDGKRPTASSMVRCHYEGTLIDGTVFDSSYRSGSPIDFPLSGVIAGWTEGLQYMTEGAKFRFVIPYNLAYGPYGAGSIPPFSTLIFTVELIEVY